MIVYTGGTFDIPHAGHVNFFKQIKWLFPNCDLTVSLNTDEFIERYKKYKPLFTFQERCHLLLQTGYVDRVVTNVGGEDSRPAIEKVKPAVIAIGNDWLEKDYCKQMGFDAKWLRERGISLIYLPYTDGISTTEIKKRIKDA